MEEKDFEKQYARLKRGIKEGWLFNDKEDFEADEDDDYIRKDTESLFEKYKNSLKNTDK